MKAVYSFLSTPFRSQGTRATGGFYDLETFYCSWVLSVLNSKLTLGRVELITDDYGRDLLSELKLPFDRISTELNTVDYHHELWAVGKIHAYLMQDEPFLHVDHDVYLWRGLPERFRNVDFICQNIETHDYYDGIIKKFSEMAKYKPSFVQEYMNRNGNEVFALNMGVFGGYNNKAIRAFSEEALKTISHPDNLDFLNDLKNNHTDYYGLYNDLNLLIEQYYAGVYAKQENLMYEMVIDKRYEEIPYTHLISGSKLEYSIANMVKSRCKQDCNPYYERIQKIIKGAN